MARMVQRLTHWWTNVWINIWIRPRDIGLVPPQRSRIDQHPNQREGYLYIAFSEIQLQLWHESAHSLRLASPEAQIALITHSDATHLDNADEVIYIDQPERTFNQCPLPRVKSI